MKQKNKFDALPSFWGNNNFYYLLDLPDRTSVAFKRTKFYFNTAEGFNCCVKAAAGKANVRAPVGLFYSFVI